jgi:hypothetical protein
MSGVNQDTIISSSKTRTGQNVLSNLKSDSHEALGIRQDNQDTNQASK